MPTKQELFEFIKSWIDGLSMIRTAYKKNENYKNMALEFINKHYLFNEESVLFKPTLTNKTIFRNSIDDALSYFIGGKYSEDTGFALKAYESIQKHPHRSPNNQKHSKSGLNRQKTKCGSRSSHHATKKAPD